MSATEYASAVAAVKAMESGLLTHSDIDQLIGTSALSDMRTLLDSKLSFPKTMEEVWGLLTSYAPGNETLKILLYRNDFHNLKAVLKSKLSGREVSGCCVSPSNVNYSEIDAAFTSKDYDTLPAYMREAADDAYELATRTLDGQLSDSIIDKAALAAMQKSADDLGNDFMKRFAVLTTVCADIKTAYRCSLMQKPRHFLERAICGSSELDREFLIWAALSGTDGLLRQLEATPYNEAVKLLRESPAQFEKWCDDIIVEHAESARMQAFGVEPLAAYYIAKEAELKNLRILTVCKECGTDRDTITERMRKLYV
ncbi:MAG: V-type ATPase subunit [Ruminococcus sp.]|nr:V-type ATPase subunit [Ruminococcus sp.]